MSLMDLSEHDIVVRDRRLPTTILTGLVEKSVEVPTAYMTLVY